MVFDYICHTMKMNKPTLDEIEALVAKLMFPFYDIKRDAVLRLKERRFENDAEHSWSVAFLACALAPQVDPSLDPGKVAQFGLVHDLVEVYAGDTKPWGDMTEIATKEEREARALEQLAAEYAHFPWMAETIREYERKDSAEARFVWAVDKLIILIVRHLDEGQFYRDAGITKAFFDERNQEHRHKAHAHPAVGDYYDQIRAVLDAHPEYFAAEGH